ncbi:MAG: DUF1553 domain-containing protein [Bryobacteraceae bacterium]
MAGPGSILRCRLQQRPLPYAFTYRDWVIGAFNADMPYDRFVVRQLAADQLEEGSAHLPALGFLSLGFNTPRLTNQPDNVDDRIDTVTRTFLGLTVSCARCHDHKYDPIPTRDYYSLYGVFANTHSPADPAPAAPPGPASPLDRYYLPRLATRLAAIDGYKRERLAEIAAEARQPETVAKYLRTAWEARGMTNPQVENLSKERNLNLRILQRWRAWTAGDRTLSGAQQLDDATLDAIVRRLADSGFLETPAAPPSLPLEDFIHVLTEGDFNTTNNLRWKRDRVFADYAYRGALLGAPPRAMQVADNARIVPAHVFIRGNPNDPGAEVPPQFLSVIGGKQPARFTHGAGRLDLARAIVDPSNPLTARVWVNRVWMHLFGEGLTRSASDFGTRGDEPSHPAMLDFLADSLMRDDWSTKKLIRRIVLSDAYRRSSSDNAAARAIDPDNRLLWRHNRRRLDFEALRDSMLVAAGRLDERIGGPSFSLESLPADPRRTMYAFVERERAQALLKAFDYADPERHTEQRDNTTVPQQSLFLMNSEFVAEQARRLSERSPGIGEMFRHALGRLPSEAERAAFAVSEPCASAPGAAPPWRYGYGEFDAAAGRVAAFTPFEFFVEDTWQAASLLPHPDSGVASLTATGGAPGPDARHAVIRRWVAPSGGTVDIAGSLSHPVDQFVRRFGLTDGIRARIVHSRLGVLGEWTFGPPEPVTAGESSEAAKKARKVETAVAGVEVRAGDTIDFAVDAIEDAEEDRFTWSPSITAVGGDSKWKAAADFAGPPLEPRCPRSQLAQVLLMSNEFAFVD